METKFGCQGIPEEVARILPDGTPEIYNAKKLLESYMEQVQALNQLREMLEFALPSAKSIAQASHLIDGFKPKPDNIHDELVRLIEEALQKHQQTEGKE